MQHDTGTVIIFNVIIALKSRASLPHKLYYETEDVI